MLSQPIHATRRAQAMRPGAKLLDHNPAWLSREWVLQAIGAAMSHRPSLARCIWLFTLLAACVIVNPFPVLAAAGDWALVCPGGDSGEPQFQAPNGAIVPIVDPGERAIAAKACNPNLSQDSGANVNVSVANSSVNTLYVAFTNYSTQTPGQISWSANCPVVNYQATITPGTTCAATVPATASLSRFCASTTQTPAGQTPNCNLAQANNQTIIETNFGTGANGVCYPTNLASCVWYDISVIPQNCTPQAWAQNHCQNTGGASYNVPASLACANEPTYTCKGPQSNYPYGNANYPSKCGNPTANCVGNSPACNNAYFWPTPAPSPNSECQPGQTLQINFLAGQ